MDCAAQIEKQGYAITERVLGAEKLGELSERLGTIVSLWHRHSCLFSS
jgi:hypothetical protein